MPQVIVIGAPAHRLEIVKKFGITATINIEEVQFQCWIVYRILRDYGKYADVIILIFDSLEQLQRFLSTLKSFWIHKGFMVNLDGV